MALKDLKLVQNLPAEVDKVQSNLREYLSQLNASLLQGNLLSNITVGTSATLISHQLGRRFQGWHIVDIQGDARVWRDTATTQQPERFLPLKASSSVVVSLWVY